MCCVVVACDYDRHNYNNVINHDFVYGGFQHQRLHATLVYSGAGILELVPNWLVGCLIEILIQRIQRSQGSGKFHEVWGAPQCV